MSADRARVAQLEALLESHGIALPPPPSPARAASPTSKPLASAPPAVAKAKPLSMLQRQLLWLEKKEAKREAEQERQEAAAAQELAKTKPKPKRKKSSRVVIAAATAASSSSPALAARAASTAAASTSGLVRKKRAVVKSVRGSAADSKKSRAKGARGTKGGARTKGGRTKKKAPPAAAKPKPKPKPKTAAAAALASVVAAIRDHNSGNMSPFRRKNDLDVYTGRGDWRAAQTAARAEAAARDEAAEQGRRAKAAATAARAEAAEQGRRAKAAEARKQQSVALMKRLAEDLTPTRAALAARRAADPASFLRDEYVATSGGTSTSHPSRESAVLAALARASEGHQQGGASSGAEFAAWSTSLPMPAASSSSASGSFSASSAPSTAATEKVLRRIDFSKDQAKAGDPYRWRFRLTKSQNFDFSTFYRKSDRRSNHRGQPGIALGCARDRATHEEHVISIFFTKAKWNEETANAWWAEHHARFPLANAIVD